AQTLTLAPGKTVQAEYHELVPDGETSTIKAIASIAGTDVKAESEERSHTADCQIEGITVTLQGIPQCIADQETGGTIRWEATVPNHGDRAAEVKVTFDDDEFGIRTVPAGQGEVVVHERTGLAKGTYDMTVTVTVEGNETIVEQATDRVELDDCGAVEISAVPQCTRVGRSTGVITWTITVTNLTGQDADAFVDFDQEWAEDELLENMAAGESRSFTLQTLNHSRGSYQLTGTVTFTPVATADAAMLLVDDADTDEEATGDSDVTDGEEADEDDAEQPGDDTGDVNDDADDDTDGDEPGDDTGSDDNDA